MNTESFICLLTAALAAGQAWPAAARQSDRAAISRRAVESGEPTWAAAQDPEKYNPRMSDFFTYALALSEANMHPERLEKLFQRSAEMQDRDPQSRDYGSFRWSWRDKTVTDQNAIEFTMQPAAIIWLRHRHTLPPAARKKLRQILEPAAVAASLRHKVSPGYTNIALMSAGNLIVLGEGLDRPDVADEGYKRLQAIVDLTAKRGISEYLSPSYYGVDLNALQLMDAFIRRPSGQRQARALLQLFWTEIAMNFWWANLRLCGPHSRDYDYLHGQGGLDSHLAAAGFVRGDDGSEGLIPSLARWQPPAELIGMSKTKLPRLVRRQWGWMARESVTPTLDDPTSPVTWSGGGWASYTHWLAADVTLGSGGANYGPIDVPLTVDLPGPRDNVRCYFIPDGRHDPYGKSKIPWRGHPKAVHLQPFFVSVQETQDALALVVYRDQDVPAECKTLESHFVMPSAIDAVYVGEQKVDFASDAPRSIDLQAGEAVFLRKGGAAVAVRVPAARTLDGDAAPVSLVWDGNDWGAIRLTVDHRKTQRPAMASAAAAFHVRVGSQLSELAFAEFRRAFTAARCEVSLEPGQISLQSPAATSGRIVAIAAAAPWTKPSRLEPAPSSAVLEIDGEDVGRKLGFFK